MYRVIEAYLTPNPYSRPQKPMGTIHGVVIHWVGNPMSTAMANRDYFERQKIAHEFASAHEIIDLNGDIVYAIPSNEIAYHCGSKSYTQRCLNQLGNYPNGCTYGIECTHVDWNGKMTPQTYNTLMERCADLCRKWQLNPFMDLWTHKEVVGWKDCHKWFVYNPHEWDLFKEKVSNMLNPQTFPQWQVDCVNYLTQLGFLRSYHTPVEILTFGTFGNMMNNYLDKLPTIDPVVYLLNKGIIKNYHDRGEAMTLATLGYIMENLEGVKDIPPIDYLLQKNYITSRHDPYEPLFMWLLGAVLKNIINIKGRLV